MPPRVVLREVLSLFMPPRGGPERGIPPYMSPWYHGGYVHPGICLPGTVCRCIPLRVHPLVGAVHAAGPCCTHGRVDGCALLARRLTRLGLLLRKVQKRLKGRFYAQNGEVNRGFTGVLRGFHCFRRF